MKKVLFIFFLLSSVAIYSQNAILDQLIFEIRNPQTDSVCFRNALEKIGEYLALDVACELDTKESRVHTLTDADAVHHLIDENPVLVTILRAGIPLNLGVQKVFPYSKVGFIVMARDEETLKADVSYVALPSLADQTVILADTMLATGGSIFDALEILVQCNPKRIFVITAIAAKPGIARILQKFPNVKIFAGAIDSELNESGFIVPGLGDAGDRSYGEKVHTLQNMGETQ